MGLEGIVNLEGVSDDDKREIVKELGKDIPMKASESLAEYHERRRGEIERVLGMVDGSGEGREVESEKEQEEELRRIIRRVKKENGNRKDLDDLLFAVGKGFSLDEDGETYEMVEEGIGMGFDAHGIAKTNQLDSLLSLLRDGISKEKDFFTAPFRVLSDYRARLGAGFGTAGGEAYKDGLAVVVSGYGGKLREDGIKFVFINDVFGDLVGPLREMFPQYGIYKLSEQKRVLEGDYNRGSGGEGSRVA